MEAPLTSRGNGGIMKPEIYISKTEKDISRTLKVLGITFFFWAVLSGLYLISPRSLDQSGTNLLALGVIALTGTFIFFSIFNREGELSLDISRPLSVYGIFYFLYYLLPYLLLFYNGLISTDNELFIACLFLLGYIAWYVGVRSSRVGDQGIISLASIGKREAKVLTGIGIVGIALVIYLYVWRSAEGIFFNQARYYEQETSVIASFREVFVGSLQLPLLLLLGSLAAVGYRRIAKASRVLFIVYGAVSFIVLVLSSQTRPAVTVLVFILIGIKLHRKLIIRLRHILVVGLLSASAVILVQGMRIVDREEFAEADNQFAYAIQNSLASAVEAATESTSTMTGNITNRAGANVIFISDIIDATQGGSGYLYGEGTWSLLEGVIPRFLWPDKPVVISSQVVFEEKLNMKIQDAPLSLINQCYAEGGWVGVMAGYFAFGWLFGKLTNRVLKKTSVGMLLTFFFIWSAVVQIENEQVIGTLLILRSALVVYLIYLAALHLLPRSRSSASI